MLSFLFRTCSSRVVSKKTNHLHCHSLPIVSLLLIVYCLLTALLIQPFKIKDNLRKEKEKQKREGQEKQLLFYEIISTGKYDLNFLRYFSSKIGQLVSVEVKSSS